MMRLNLQAVRRIGRALLVAPLLVVAQNCTDLTETPHDALTPENAFKTDAELLAGVAAVYASMRWQDQEAFGGYVALGDLTADVMIVPTRGSDWYDNGQWLDLHRQTWTPNSAGTTGAFNNSWNQLFGSVAKANLMIGVIEDAIAKGPVSNGDRTLAELRTLRAWFYYMLQDHFGGAPPLVSTDSAAQYPSSTRPEIFSFIESELLAAIPDLPDSWPADGYGRMTKGAANAILAALYINAGVFNKNSTDVSATAYNSCAGVQVSGGITACQGAINSANAVINSGLYTLAPSGQWANNFARDNQNSTENIFVLVYTSEGSLGLGGNWPFRTLHYNQLSSGWGSPWNGFATLAETYNQFDANDERRGMWLEGQAFSFETGQPVNDRTGNPLVFTVNIPDATQANEAHGVRFNKFPPLPSAATGNAMPNDFPFFRISEMYLIKAEALLEQGDAAGALVELNRVHSLRNPTPVAAATRDAILRERLLEFAGEGKRRADLIRHGRYTSWTEASLNGVATGPRDAKLILFPVPQPQLASNPKLVQNPGY